MEKTVLKISGMHCASCATVITRALTKTDGVKDANVNYSTGSGTVTFDEGKASETDLIDAVKRKGYGAEILAGSKL